MGIQNLTIKDGATSLSVTGGTDQTYTPDGQTVNNGVHVAVAAVSDFRVRPHISFRNVAPRKLANGQFSSGQNKISLTEPYLHTDGNVYYVTVERIITANPVIPAANVKNARFKMAQLCFDTDTEDFNTSGSLA